MKQKLELLASFYNSIKYERMDFVMYIMVSVGVKHHVYFDEHWNKQAAIAVFVSVQNEFWPEGLNLTAATRMEADPRTSLSVSSWWIRLVQISGSNSLELGC